MDRLSPQLRPAGKNAGTQKWRDLAFFHWPVAPSVLRPLVPAELELDLWEGSAFVGLLPFAMEEVRPALVPPSLGLNLLETNLRTYVHLAGRDPGVYFFSLDAASRLAVWGARLAFSLPYFFADMKMDRLDNKVRYETRRRSDRTASLVTQYETGPVTGPAKPNSLEEFLVERYLLYTQRRRRLMVAQVHHAPYPLAEARVHTLEEGLCAASHLPAQTSPPTYAHFSPGVDVEVFGLRPVDTDPD